jgi:hypothetical protein
VTTGLDRDYTERVDRDRVRRVLVRAIVFVAALNLAVIVGGEIFAPSSEGPRGSTFSTEGDGSAAWFELLGRIGVDVERRRVPAADATLDAGSMTLVILEPSAARVEEADVDAVERFVRAGGRVVTTSGNDFIRRLIPGLTRNRADIQRAGAVGEGPELADAAVVRFDSSTYFADVGAVERLLETPAGLPVALVANLGAGRVVALVDSSPVSNQLIAAADNAAFAVGITGGREVVFDEYVHGYGIGEGLGGLPAALRTLAAVLLLAGVIWIWATGRRLGQPEQAGRALPPARVEFIDAMGATLARSEPGESGYGDLRVRGLELLERYAHGRTDIGTDTATALGLTEFELDALRQPVRSKQAVEAIGSAVAKLERISVGGGMDGLSGSVAAEAPEVQDQLNERSHT